MFTKGFIPFLLHMTYKHCNQLHFKPKAKALCKANFPLFPKDCTCYQTNVHRRPWRKCRPSQSLSTHQSSTVLARSIGDSTCPCPCTPESLLARSMVDGSQARGTLWQQCVYECINVYGTELTVPDSSTLSQDPVQTQPDQMSFQSNCLMRDFWICKVWPHDPLFSLLQNMTEMDSDDYVKQMVISV